MSLLNSADTFRRMVGNKPDPGARIVPGLPPMPGGRNPRQGATNTILGAAQRPPFTDVVARPSMKIVAGSNGAIMTVQEMRSKWADWMTADDLKPVYQLLDQVEAEAIRLSQGSISLKELARRNHPYGRGLSSRGKRGRIAPSGRAGIPSLAIVNKQSGKFAESWDTQIQHFKSGIRLVLGNDAPYAAWLARGTTRMVAHGPFTAAMVKFRPKIDGAWSSAAKKAYARAMAEVGI